MSSDRVKRVEKHSLSGGNLYMFPFHLFCIYDRYVPDCVKNNNMNKYGLTLPVLFLYFYKNTRGMKGGYVFLLFVI